MRFLTPVLTLLGAAFWAVLARIFAQPAVERLIAKLVFKLAHWLAGKTSNRMDNELVHDLEEQYYAHPGTKLSN